MNADEFAAEIRALAVKKKPPCAVCVLPQPMKQAIAIVSDDPSVPKASILEILAKHGHKVNKDRLTKHLRECDK